MATYRTIEVISGDTVTTKMQEAVIVGGQIVWKDCLVIPQDRDTAEVIMDDIPPEASPENQLADKNYVNDKVATDSATFRGTYNLVSSLGLTTAATREETVAALATVISEADNNDFSNVEIPTADDKPTEIARVDRYKFNGTAWAFEFSQSGSGFTSDQWDAINSGIISALVTKLSALPTAAEMAEESDFQENLAAIMSLAVDPNAGVTTVTTNPEWKMVYTDADDRILLGKRQDNTWYFADDLNDILDAIIDGYGS